jgi:predicted amidophosphoribosyltransferase
LRIDVLRRSRLTGAQTELDAVERRRNVRRAFVVEPRAPMPAHVAVLDDVMTTGATLAECALALKRAGVARVDVWALARAPAPGT